MARDAAEIKPRFVPDDELLGRDDSGGPEFTPYTARFGDGGRVTGPKAYLSASGGGEDREKGDEIDRSERGRAGMAGMTRRDKD